MGVQTPSHFHRAHTLPKDGTVNSPLSPSAPPCCCHLPRRPGSQVLAHWQDNCSESHYSWGHQEPNLFFLIFLFDSDQLKIPQMHIIWKFHKFDYRAMLWWPARDLRKWAEFRTFSLKSSAYLDNFSQKGGNQNFVLRTALIGWSGTDPGEKLSRDRSAVCQRGLHGQPDIRRLLQARSWCWSWQCRCQIVIFTWSVQRQSASSKIVMTTMRTIMSITSQYFYLKAWHFPSQPKIAAEKGGKLNKGNTSETAFMVPW